MPKTRASFLIAEEVQPARKRPRRSCNARGGALKEVDDNVPQPKRRARELKKAPKSKKSQNLDNAPTSKSRGRAGEDETPERRKLPKRKGRGVRPLRLREEIVEDDEKGKQGEEEEDDDLPLAVRVKKEAPRRRSSARIQKQSNDKHTATEQFKESSDNKGKSKAKLQTKTKLKAKAQKQEEEKEEGTLSKSNKSEEPAVETVKRRRNLDEVVEKLTKKRDVAGEKSYSRDVKNEPGPAEPVQVKSEPQEAVKHEVKLERQNDVSMELESSSATPKDQTKPTLRPPIKVKVVDDEQLRDNKMMMYDFIAQSTTPAPVLKTPITVVQDENVSPIIDLTDGLKEYLSEGSTTLEEVHRACMGLQREKAAFQPAMPERPKIFDDIEANDGEQEKKMRELRKNLKAEAPVCDCGKRGRSKWHTGAQIHL